MIAEREGRLFVSGPMSFDTAAALAAAGDTLIGAGERVIDLGEVSHSDSAALAVALAWLRAAQARGGRLCFVRAPAIFTTLAQLYGVADLIPTEAAHVPSA